MTRRGLFGLFLGAAVGSRLPLARQEVAIEAASDVLTKTAAGSTDSSIVTALSSTYYNRKGLNALKSKFKFGEAKSFKPLPKPQKEVSFYRYAPSEMVYLPGELLSIEIASKRDSASGNKG